MNLNLAIATMTWARDAREDALLRAALRALTGTGTPLYVTDGGSTPDFVAFVRSLPNTTLCETRAGDLWGQVRASLSAASASGASFVLYTEPDKRDFFRSRLESFLSEAPRDGDVGVVLVSRSREAYATFPAFQRYTENVINRCCAEVIGKTIDYSYGPFLVSASILPYLEHAPMNVGWGWRPFVFALAHRLGRRVESVERGSGCPEDQRIEEARARLYRMEQMTESVSGLLAAARVPLTRGD